MEPGPSVLGFVTDFQTLIAGFLAVCAAGIAFLSVVYAQHRIDRRTKAESERSLRSQARQIREEREHKLRSLISALTGELSVAYQNASRRQELIQSQLIVARGLRRKSSIKPYLGQVSDTTIYDSIASEVGLFYPLMASSLAEVYATIKGWSRSVAVGSDMPAEDAVFLLQVQLTSSERATSKIHDVVMRLHSIRLGHGDPGICSGANYFEAKIKPVLPEDDPAADQLTRSDPIASPVSNSST